MAPPNKQRILAKLLTVAGKRYHDKLPKDLSVLDHLLFGVLQEGASPSQTLPVFRQLLEGFHDFNELRVSHPQEVEALLDGLPLREEKAKRVISILQFVFETTYAFDLESMRRKPLKQAQRQLSKITGVTPFTVAAVVQRSLGGHALPLDTPMCQLLAKLHLIEEGEGPEEVRTGLEHLVPKAKGLLFSHCVSELAADVENQAAILASILPAPRRRAAPIKLPERRRGTASKSAATGDSNGNVERTSPPRKPAANRSKRSTQ